MSIMCSYHLEWLRLLGELLYTPPSHTISWYHAYLPLINPAHLKITHPPYYTISPPVTPLSWPQECWSCLYAWPSSSPPDRFFIPCITPQLLPFVPLMYYHVYTLYTYPNDIYLSPPLMCSEHLHPYTVCLTKSGIAINSEGPGRY